MQIELPSDINELPVEIQDGDRRLYLISAEQYEKLRLLLEVEQVDRSVYEAGEIHLYSDE